VAGHDGQLSKSNLKHAIFASNFISVRVILLYVRSPQFHPVDILLVAGLRDKAHMGRYRVVAAVLHVES
jgi:hypothetical protein